MAQFTPYNKMQMFEHLAYKYSSDSVCVEALKTSFVSKAVYIRANKTQQTWCN